MNDISMFYPDFIANQVLTNTQLNNLRDYLDGQDRRGRIRLAGTGVICGLNYAHDAVANTITLYGGYGLSSDGYLIEVETKTYGNVTAYEDPDSVEGVPNYESWTSGIPATMLEGIYLLSDDPEHDPLSALDLSDYVVLLYLEREEVDLNSCLVTECDNKGINVNLTVRPLLVRKVDLEQLPACVAPEAIRVPRLKTELDLASVDNVNDINGAYATIIGNALPELEGRLRAVKNLPFPEGLGIEEPVDDLVDIFLETINNALGSGEINQYHYDYIKDIAVAYNEAITEFCKLVPDCFASGNFPRHLLLGAALKDADGYRNEFTPSPFKNVFVLGENRVYQLFGRLFAMLEKFSLPQSPVLRITPSQTERYPLGERAVPFYYTEFATAFMPNWQPQGCCDLKPLWSYYKPDLAQNDLDFDYSDSSFLRIEGHLGAAAEVTLNLLKNRRKNQNVEFGILPVYINDLQQELDGMQRALDEMHAAVLARYSKIGQVIYAIQSGATSYKDGANEIRELLQDIDAREGEIGEKMEEWQTLYGARVPLCDYAAQATEYVGLRTELLCSLYELKGLLKEAVIIIDKIDELKDDEPLTSLLAYMGLHALVLLHRGMWLIQHYLPSSINETNFPLLLSNWREFYAALMMFCLLYKRAEAEQGAEESYTLLCGLREADKFLQHFHSFEARTSVLARRFIQLKTEHINTLSNVARFNPGLEHLAGVEPGGEFIAVFDGALGTEKVVADFALAGGLTCCCENEVITGLLHGHAQLDIVVIKLKQEKNGNFLPVATKIPVMENDFELVDNADALLYVDLESDTTDLSGQVKEDELSPNVINYTHNKPAPFAIDKFYYKLRNNKDEKMDETGVVIVLHWFEAKGTGLIKGKVVTEVDGVTGPVAASNVLLNEEGRSVETPANGRFQFKDLPVGIHTLYASKEGYRTEVRTIELEEGEEDSIEIVLQQLLPGTIKGWTQLVYKLATGEYVYNLPGITVSIANSTIEPVVSSEAGSFSFEQIMPRKYTLETYFEADGYRLKPKTRTIVLGETEVQHVYFKFTIEDFEAIAATNDLQAIALNDEYYAVAAANYLGTSYKLAQLREGMSADAVGTYADVERFTKEEVINPGLTKEEKQQRYEAVVQEIDKAMATAPAAEKADYQAMLEAASTAYLDVVAVSSTGMTAETKIAVDSVAANIKSAGIDTAAFSDTWSRSASFSLASEGVAMGMRELIN